MRALGYFFAICFAVAAQAQLPVIPAASHIPAASGGPVMGDVTGVVIDSSGASAHVYINKGTNGSFTMGLATNNTGTPNIAFAVTSQGFDDSANATTIARTVYGTTPMRLGYPNNHALSVLGTGASNIFQIALSAPVWAGDSNITFTMASSTYSNCAASSSVIVTNLSTLAYPKVNGWPVEPDFQLVGTNYTYPIFASSLLTAQQGRPVRCVIPFAVDQHSHGWTGSVQTAWSVTTNSLDAIPVIQMNLSLSSSNFTQGDNITNYFKAYPWIGDSTSVLDSSDGKHVIATPYYRPWITVCDRSNSYAPTIAIVSAAGSSSGKCIITNLNTAAPPAYFDTLAHAYAAMRLTNNSSYMPSGAVDDYRGTIYIVQDYHSYTGIPLDASPKTWTKILPYPTNNLPASFTTSSTFGGHAGHLQCLSNITWTAQQASALYNYRAFWLDNCDMNVASTSQAFIENGDVFLTRNFFTNFDQGFQNFSTDPTIFKLIRGNTTLTGGEIGSGGQAGIHPYCVIGNLFQSTNGYWIKSTTVAPTFAADPVLVMNNKLMNYAAGNSSLSFGSTAEVITNGSVFAQNIVERTRAELGANEPLVASSADDETGAIGNIQYANNVTRGARCNSWYNWSLSSSVGYATNCAAMGDIWYHWCTKHDSEATANASRTNRWNIEYGVGFVGELILDETNYNGFNQAQKSFYPVFVGLSSYMPPFTAAWPSTDPPQGLYSNDHKFVGFFNDQGSYGYSTNNLGFGDYHLSATNSPFASLVGPWVLPFDISGVARTANTHVGAYENTQ